MNLSTVSTAVRVLWDTADVIDRLGTRPPENVNAQFMDNVSLANQCFMIATQVGELVGIAKGCPSSTLQKFKHAELVGRAIDIPTQGMKYFFTPASTAETIEQGYLRPIASALRVGCQAEVYQERAYLEMPPEERARAMRPIYGSTGDSIEIVGHKPIIEKECHQNVDFYQPIAHTSFVVEAAATAKAVQPFVSGLGTLLYPYYLAIAVRLGYGAPAANEMRNEGQAVAGNGIINEPEVDHLAIVALPRIPLALENDAVLRQNICPITQSPIRHIAGDPNGITLYERAAILEWIAQAGTSPATRLPLQANQLIERPDLQNGIDNRLRFIEERLRAVVAQFEVENAD